MKEIKTFFANDNRLNKGYAKTSDPRESDSSFYSKKFEHILPPIDVITTFENINPGTLKQIIDMAEREQHHRHALDLLNINAYNKAQKLGKIFAIALVCIISMTTLCLAIYGSILSAISFSGTAFLSIGLSLVMKKRKINASGKENNQKKKNL
jgi:uncharacterized membrane protein